jgi:hypothetical protein
VGFLLDANHPKAMVRFRFPQFVSVLVAVDLASDLLRALTGMSNMQRAVWAFHSSDGVSHCAKMIRDALGKHSGEFGNCKHGGQPGWPLCQGR